MPTTTSKNSKKDSPTDKMANVYFKKGNYSYFLDNPVQILDGVKKAGFLKTLQSGQFTGLKIHFGEKNNKSYIQPRCLSPLVNFLKKRGTKPFLLETNTLYCGQRINAVDHINIAYKHGFGILEIPVIIADGLRGNDYIPIEVNLRHFRECYIGQALKDTDVLLVLSHFTGHILTGFGAAIKNIGMGCASRKGKLAQHCALSPKIRQEQCVQCGACAQCCPAQAIKNEAGGFFIDEEKCIGCAQCTSVCGSGAVKIIWSEAYQEIAEKIVEYAYAAVRNKSCFYVNFCLYMTKECDCMNKDDRGFIEDLGILFGTDPVAVDKACIDLLNKRENRDVLRQAYPHINYLHYLDYAQSIGLGSIDYKLIEI